MPFFSVIIPTYNRAHLLDKAIKSVLKQTFRDWELIIVDDGSTDNTGDMIQSFSEERIKYVYQDNKGRSAARNSGIIQARGSYICFLDSDDYYLEHHLEVFYKILIANNHPVAFLANPIFKRLEGDKKEVLFNKKNLNSLSFFADNLVHSQQVCVHLSILLEEQYDPLLTIGEDMELWFRIASKQPVLINDTPTVVVVDHLDRSINQMINNPGKEQLEAYKVMFLKGHPGRCLPGSTRRFLISNAYSDIAKHYMFNKKNFPAIKYLLLSFLAKPIHPGTKHKFFCIFSLIFFGKVKEYST